MKAILTAAALMLGAVFASGAAQASTIVVLPEGETTVKVTADLTALGLAGAPTGTADVTLMGCLPVFAFNITGGSQDMAGELLIEHDGSGVMLSAIADPSVSATVGDFLISTANANVSGSVNGGMSPVELFTFGDITGEGIELLISGDLAGALSAVFGAPNLAGAQFGFANTAPQTATVPLPAGAPLLLAALAGLALARRRA